MPLEARERAILAASLSQLEALIADGNWDGVANGADGFIDLLTEILDTAEGGPSAIARDGTTREELMALLSRLQSITERCQSRLDQVRPLLEVLTNINNRASAP